MRKRSANVATAKGFCLCESEASAATRCFLCESEASENGWTPIEVKTDLVKISYSDYFYRIRIRLY
ncbi:MULTISPECIES: hypothetical protein [Lysinibacillus]|uniref:hypothetical protein n=1 Tax=Lysinibacillus TaxID=400634 RepID=UPI001112A2ED|nr:MULTISPECIES: hypothetical protein [Lysinibacillus]